MEESEILASAAYQRKNVAGAMMDDDTFDEGQRRRRMRRKKHQMREDYYFNDEEGEDEKLYGTGRRREEVGLYKIIQKINKSTMIVPDSAEMEIVFGRRCHFSVLCPVISECIRADAKQFLGWGTKRRTARPVGPSIDDGRKSATNRFFPKIQIGKHLDNFL